MSKLPVRRAARLAAVAPPPPRLLPPPPPSGPGAVIAAHSSTSNHVTCYLPSGQETSDYEVCTINHGWISMCCPRGYTCASENSTCIVTEASRSSNPALELGTAVRGACTDQNWDEEACGRRCPGASMSPPAGYIGRRTSGPDAGNGKGGLVACGSPDDGGAERFCCEEDYRAGICDCPTRGSAFAMFLSAAQKAMGKRSDKPSQRISRSPAPTDIEGHERRAITTEPASFIQPVSPNSAASSPTTIANETDRLELRSSDAQDDTPSLSSADEPLETSSATFSTQTFNPTAIQSVVPTYPPLTTPISLVSSSPRSTSLAVKLSLGLGIPFAIMLIIAAVTFVHRRQRRIRRLERHRKKKRLRRAARIPFHQISEKPLPLRRPTLDSSHVSFMYPRHSSAAPPPLRIEPPQGDGEQQSLRYSELLGLYARSDRQHSSYRQTAGGDSGGSGGRGRGPSSASSADGLRPAALKLPRQGTTDQRWTASTAPDILRRSAARLTCDGEPAELGSPAWLDRSSSEAGEGGGSDPGWPLSSSPAGRARCSSAVFSPDDDMMLRIQYHHYQQQQQQQQQSQQSHQSQQSQQSQQQRYHQAPPPPPPLAALPPTPPLPPPRPYSHHALQQTPQRAEPPSASHEPQQQQQRQQQQQKDNNNDNSPSAYIIKWRPSQISTIHEGRSVTSSSAPTSPTSPGLGGSHHSRSSAGSHSVLGGLWPPPPSQSPGAGAGGGAGGGTSGTSGGGTSTPHQYRSTPYGLWKYWRPAVPPDVPINGGSNNNSSNNNSSNNKDNSSSNHDRSGAAAGGVGVGVGGSVPDLQISDSDAESQVLPIQHPPPLAASSSSLGRPQHLAVAVDVPRGGAEEVSPLSSSGSGLLYPGRLSAISGLSPH